MFGQLRALIESVRLEMHDALSELHDVAQQKTTAPEGPKGGRIKTGEDATRAALEAAVAPLKEPRTDTAVAAAIAENTAAVNKLCAAFEALSKTLGKPRKRTGTVQLPDGPVTMTVTEH